MRYVLALYIHTLSLHSAVACYLSITDDCVRHTVGVAPVVIVYPGGRILAEVRHLHLVLLPIRVGVGSCGGMTDQNKRRVITADGGASPPEVFVGQMA